MHKCIRIYLGIPGYKHLAIMSLSKRIIKVPFIKVIFN